MEDTKEAARPQGQAGTAPVNTPLQMHHVPWGLEKLPGQGGREGRCVYEESQGLPGHCVWDPDQCGFNTGLQEAKPQAPRRLSTRSSVPRGLPPRSRQAPRSLLQTPSRPVPPLA